MGITNKLKGLKPAAPAMSVTLDPADNSVTLSRALFCHMRAAAAGHDRAQVFVFRVPGRGFGFVLNPDISQPTQLCDIQYNSQHNCVGFETLCPSVGAIFHEFRLPAEGVRRLLVTVEKTAGGMVYYLINPPTDGKHS